ncbi:MAG: EamA family transporter [Betaproteobacteria bacterium]|nr:EamA family transporter [Betaproteobacteria bacterium]
MTPVALGLILAAAIVHATWNYFLKRSGGGPVFVWLFASLSALIYAPLAAGILWWQKSGFGWIHLGLMLASAVLHTAYYLLLDRGYRGGDLSVVYPLARGSGPLITMLCAVLLLQERPSAIAVVGALSIAGGAVLLMGDPRKLRRSGNHHAVGFALLTGCMIAAYTLVDKVAVAAYLIPPLVQDWAANLGRVMLMTPMALRRKTDLMPVWRRSRNEIIAVATLCPLSYILVLTAMVFTPVSYVAPAREISILVAALMGTQLLAEGDTARRLFAAGAMVGGVILLALG